VRYWWSVTLDNLLLQNLPLSLEELPILFEHFLFQFQRGLSRTKYKISNFHWKSDLILYVYTSTSNREMTHAHQIARTQICHCCVDKQFLHELYQKSIKSNNTMRVMRLIKLSSNIFLTGFFGNFVSK
jgi:hypothetical protein